MSRKKAPDPDEIEIVGVPPTPLRDLYHLMLRAPWWADLGGLSAAVLLLNLLFAIAFQMVGGVEGAHEHSLREMFYFSIQTFGTIGYGAMYPSSNGAQIIVTIESIVGMFTVALVTGLIFAKFSRTAARLEFADHAVIAPFDGVPTLMFRLGNQRASMIVEAVVRVIMYRTERTVEGVIVYRMHDLPLTRERAPSLSRSWTVMHRLDEKSVIYKLTPEIVERDEIEFAITVTGIDEVSGQTLHGRERYLPSRLRWGYRHKDLLSERDDGGLRMDIRLFHDIVATTPTDEFPYPASAPGPESKPA